MRYHYTFTSLPKIKRTDNAKNNAAGHWAIAVGTESGPFEKQLNVAGGAGTKVEGWQGAGDS